MNKDDQHYLVNSIAHHLGALPCFPEGLARALPPDHGAKYLKPYEDLRSCLDAATSALPEYLPVRS